MTMFDAPGWAPNPAVRVQGLWYRFAVERPNPQHGWTIAIDSAITRNWSPTFGFETTNAHIASAFGPMQSAHTGINGLCQDASKGWENGRQPTLGRAFTDLSPEAESWVGTGWVKGWATDETLATGGFVIGQSPSRWSNLIIGLLDALERHGNPHGVGWGYTAPPAGKEAERLPWNTPAHQKLGTAQMYGMPKPWDHQSARVSWSLMARVHESLVA